MLKWPETTHEFTETVVLHSGRLIRIGYCPETKRQFQLTYTYGTSCPECNERTETSVGALLNALEDERRAS